MRIASVDDDITLFEIWFELIEKVVYGWARLDQEDDLSRFLELGAKLWDRVSTLNLCTLTMVTSWEKKYM